VSENKVFIETRILVTRSTYYLPT